LIPGQSVWDLLWTKRHCDGAFPKYFLLQHCTVIRLLPTPCKLSNSQRCYITRTHAHTRNIPRTTCNSVLDPDARHVSRDCLPAPISGHCQTATVPYMIDTQFCISCCADLMLQMCISRATLLPQKFMLHYYCY
jgi:hypothetical protein